MPQLINSNFTTAVNACDPKYNALCDDRGHCSPFDESGLTSLKVTCSCPEGYEGNGLNASKRMLYYHIWDIIFDFKFQNCIRFEFLLDLSFIFLLIRFEFDLHFIV